MSHHNSSVPVNQIKMDGEMVTWNSFHPSIGHHKVLSGLVQPLQEITSFLKIKAAYNHQIAFLLLLFWFIKLSLSRTHCKGPDGRKELHRRMQLSTLNDINFLKGQLSTMKSGSSSSVQPGYDSCQPPRHILSSFRQHS